LHKSQIDCNKITSPDETGLKSLLQMPTRTPGDSDSAPLSCSTNKNTDHRLNWDSQLQYTVHSAEKSKAKSGEIWHHIKRTVARTDIFTTHNTYSSTKPKFYI